MSFQLLSYVPFSLGPVSLTIVLEAILILSFAPEISSYLLRPHRRQRVFVLVVSVMLAQLFLTFGRISALREFKLLSVSLLYYILIIVAFHRDTQRSTWITRLHLIPALGVVFLFFFQNVRFSWGPGVDLADRLGGNFSPAYLAMMVPIGWVRLGYERGVFRWLNLLMIAAAFVLELLSASRAGFVCLAVAVLLSAITLPWRRRATLAFVFLALVGAALVSLPRMSDWAIVERISTLREPELEMGGRLALQRAALRFIREHPFLGGDFRAEVLSLVPQEAPDSRISRAIAAGVWTTQSGPHNGYLNVMAEHGIPLGVLFIGYFVRLYMAVSRGRRHAATREQSEILRAASLSLLVFGLYMFADHVYSASQFFVLAAIMECYVGLPSLELAQVAPDSGRGRLIHTRRVALYGARFGNRTRRSGG